MNITSTNIAARDYLCLNRLHYIVAYIKGKFPDMLQEDDELIRLLAISRRLESLPTGLRKELPFPVADDTWGVVSALPGGRCCHLINGCYYNQARYLRHLAGNVCYDAFCEVHGWESYRSLHKFPHFGGASSGSPTSFFSTISGPRLTQPSENCANTSSRLYTTGIRYLDGIE